jgi:predicted nucleic acid-binding protein
MRVLLDTNVILDFLLDREPFSVSAELVWQAIQQGRVEGYISPITPVNVFYIARKMKGVEYARQLVVGLLAVCPACPLDDSTMQAALKMPLIDYEDAVQLASALAYQLDAIITRDTNDFAGASIPVHSPADFLKELSRQ